MRKVQSAFKKKASIYKISGTLAALVTESVWDTLLKGQPVGVWEQDNTKWSLFRNGKHVQTVTAPDDTGAVMKFAAASVEFNAFCNDMCAGRKDAFLRFDIKQGYPVILDLPAGTLKRFSDQRLDSKKAVERMRALTAKAHRGLSIEAAAEEVLNMGSTREGAA